MNGFANGHKQVFMPATALSCNKCERVPDAPDWPDS